MVAIFWRSCLHPISSNAPGSVWPCRALANPRRLRPTAGSTSTRVKVVTFAVSAFFMGATGATMSMRWTYIDPTTAFSIQFSFMPVLMAIFGGMGHLYAPIAGATIFSLLEEMLTTKFPYYYMLLFGLIMLVVILFMPLRAGGGD